MSKQEVKMIAAGLRVGEDSGFVECPFCRAAHEDKFSVTRLDTGLVYHCFRATCGASGFIGTGYWEAEVGEKPQRPKKRPYMKKLEQLTPEDWKFFSSTWCIRPDQFAVTENDEYALPLLNPNGYRRGWIIRQPKWKGRECPRKGRPDLPKALTYKDEPDHPKLSWAPGPPSTSMVVVVEDILSAWKINQTKHHPFRAVALNGTDMGYSDVVEIGKESPLLVAIWLDPGAENQAYKIQRKWGLSFNYCCVLTSPEDPKDMSRTDIQEVLSNAGWEGD